MKYEQRLKAAANIVLDDDTRAGESPINCADFGITGSLKPHQVEGLYWLIRRYRLGVNVVLGEIFCFAVRTFSALMIPVVSDYRMFCWFHLIAGDEVHSCVGSGERNGPKNVLPLYLRC